MFGEPEKRKTSDRPRLSWWLLIVGFVLGVVVTLIFRPVGSTVTVYSSDNGQFELTATAIIAGATASAESLIIQNDIALSPASSEGDSLILTATALVAEITTTAEAQRVEDDGFYLTATYFVSEATRYIEDLTATAAGS